MFVSCCERREGRCPTLNPDPPLQADSGHSPPLYQQLAVAPTLLLDARQGGSSEHASFEELASTGGLEVGGG